MKTTKGLITAAVATPLLAVTLLGCGAESSGDTPHTTEQSGPSGQSVRSGSGAADSAKAPAPADKSGLVSGREVLGPDPSLTTGKEVLGTDPKVISKGTITLDAKDVDKARAAALARLTTWKGTLADENSVTDEHGKVTEDQLQLRVPSEHFEAAMEYFSGLGTLVDRNRSAEDVTSQVVDVEARVRAQEKSLARIEALLARAKTLGEVISIETTIGQRQADLDALKSQQARLADETSMSTIALTISRPEVAPAAAKSGGFVDGLESGWHAVSVSVRVIATVLGAALPFAVLAGVVGVPLWLLLRRRTRKPLPEAA